MVKLCEWSLGTNILLDCKNLLIAEYTTKFLYFSFFAKITIFLLLLKLYNKLNFSNSYFVHRDYHAQNLMLVGKKIGVIDSQDALIGNPTYDLVSLIDDVRIKTSSKLKNIWQAW